jgi:Trypsin
MKKFLALLVLVVASIASAQVAPAVKSEQHKATIEIVMKSDKDGAGCSATAISEHVLLTAQHCDVSDALLYLNQNSRPLTNGQVVTEKYYDGNDHMLLVIPSVSFKHFVTYDASKVREITQGEHLYLWGNPSLIMDQYREVYATGSMLVNGDLPINASGKFEMTSGPAVGGDSGSAIFSEVDGQIVGITTWGMFDGMFIGSYPLRFTQAQVDQAEGKGAFVYLPDTRPQIIVKQAAPVSSGPDIDLSVIEFSLAGIFWILLLAMFGFVAYHVRKPALRVVKYFGRLAKKGSLSMLSVLKSLFVGLIKV